MIDISNVNLLNEDVLDNKELDDEFNKIFNDMMISNTINKIREFSEEIKDAFDENE